MVPSDERQTYSYGREEKRVLERSKVPFTMFRLDSGRIVTFCVSDGMCELLGMDRREATDHMDRDPLGSIHPDDLARVTEAVHRFTHRGEVYDVVYRTRRAISDRYYMVHAVGRHQTLIDGTKLCVVWYVDEGYCDEAENRAGSGSGEGARMRRELQGMIDEENRTEESHFDGLTGLIRGEYFYEQADAYREEALRRGAVPVFLFFDLHGMKGYNDRYGYGQGDRMLANVAGILRRSFGFECCGRMEADHFVVFTEASPGMEKTLDGVFEEIAAFDGGRTVPVKVGIYEITDENVSSQLAFDRAKMACDQEKDSFISRYVYYDETIRTSWNSRSYFLGNLDRALEEGWIQAYYQPLVRSVTGKVCNEEALARWVDPERGLLPPSEFIPILEEARVLYRVDLRMVEIVIEDMKRKRQAGVRVVPVSVNLSWHDFLQCDMPDEICRRMDRAGIPHDLLVIEITENVIGRDPEYMKTQIDRFHEMGFHVWMDDFGSGYSSLDLLQHFDFELIKLDMEFMRNFDSSPKSKVIMTQLIQMSTKLGIDTVSEGVETEEQVRFLREIGCDKIQGFYFSRPKPLEEFLDHYQSGAGIGMENYRESDYYDVISKTGLNDPAVSQSESDTPYNYFSAVPMGILEIRDSSYHVLRYNKTFGDFLRERIGKTLPEKARQDVSVMIEPDETLREVIARSTRSEEWQYMENIDVKGTRVNGFVKKLTVNPVNGATAVVVILISMM